ncbi:uncharacterized protein LOC132875564 isoform X2 [Neoarius graeffei]|uniref:uncharacterized protein LOC132875564 isoform X2 n=1 Tax=Neoarius graeffei TaxID=443677 RepID=UPI00298CD319|nr:uncharacterized protein LOC132875564 isoform X2 [Neoarius graeffei]
MEFLVKFWKKYVGRFGMFSLVLLGLENFLDDNFVCPCKRSYNQVICVFYCVVPAFGCLICTLCFVDLSSSTKNKEMVCTGNSRNKGQRIFYSILAVLIWLSLFFTDGRYLACAWSDWDGVLTKSDTFGIGKWCKPTGNETSEIETQQRTLKLMYISQADGRYVACGGSDWDGVFSKSDTFGIVKWCKPTGNETSEIETQQKTLELMYISQIAGYILIMGIITALVAFKYFWQNKPQQDSEEQHQRAEAVPLLENQS